jgi:hypothetical protein
MDNGAQSPLQYDPHLLPRLPDTPYMYVTPSALNVNSENRIELQEDTAVHRGTIFADEDYR